MLGTTETMTVGAGGLGGTAGVNTGNGVGVGSVGGASQFGTTVPFCVAYGGTLELGVNETGKPTERQLQFIGTSPEGFDRTYTCWRAVSVASSGHSYKRSLNSLAWPM
jgi:hypothetical protein